jgi:hypothetical protein
MEYSSQGIFCVVVVDTKQGTATTRQLAACGPDYVVERDRAHHDGDEPSKDGWCPSNRVV